MMLNRRAFDLVWLIAAALGAFSVAMADGALGGLPRQVLPVSLGLSLCISIVLSFFIKRSPATAQPSLSEEAALRERASSECPMESVSPASYESIFKDAGSGFITPVFETKDTPEITHVWTDDHAARQRNVRSLFVRHAAQALATDAQLALRQIIEHQRSEKRRNVLAEAVNIAKQLHGAGVEVCVSPDNQITIREHRDLEFLYSKVPLEEARELSSKYGWIN